MQYSFEREKTCTVADLPTDLLTKQLIGLTRSWLTVCVSETDWVNDLNKQQLNNNFFKFLYSLLLNNKIIEIMNKNRVTYSLQLADQPTDLLMDWLTVS